MEMPQYKKIKSMLKAIQSAIANNVATESTAQQILTAAQGAKTAAENANSAVSEVGGFKSPIKAEKLRPTGKAKVSGTGKGKLFVVYGVAISDSPNLQISIDGTVVFSNTIGTAVVPFEIEFTKNFECSITNSTSDNVYCWVIAVYY